MTSRTPIESRSPRMAPLSRLPIFLALEGRRVVIAGGTLPAAWKAELLSAAGALIDVYASAPGQEFLEVAADAPDHIAIHRRAWRAADLSGAAVAVADCANDAEARNFAVAARAAGVPVNIIDKPAHCDFSFGAIVNRSPLVIGISTGGAAPVFGQAIRSRIEALLPASFALWAQAARNWRKLVQASGLPFDARRRFWRSFAASALRNSERTPAPADFKALMAASHAAADATTPGTVTLVGAGPGDPELLTLRAVRALQSADVILYDDLVSTEVLDFARREARKMLVGKTGHRPSCKQEEINRLMVGLAKAGRQVVRLKGGDPTIFGRAGEEIAACRAAGIKVDVIPGITAAQGAASRLGVSLTHRSTARRLQYVTGHSVDGLLPANLDWQALADPSATTAIYMPVGTLAEFAMRAIAAGLDPATPAVAVARATCPSEMRISASIADLPERLTIADMRGPVLVLIGQTLAADATEQIQPHASRK